VDTTTQARLWQLYSHGSNNGKERYLSNFPIKTERLEGANSHQLPKDELRLMRNAIKLIAVQTILGLALVLETTPAEFANSPFPSHTGPQLPFPKNQTPRLLNRQIKVVFFAIYKSLITQVLNGFKAIASNRKSWSSCIFVGICLAFLIERIETGNQEYVIFSQGSVYQDNQESFGDAEGYCEAVESVVFARLYRVLATVTRRRNAGNGVMDLQEILRGVRKEFGEFLCLLSWGFGLILL
jgi:hypothetical protein